MSLAGHCSGLYQQIQDEGVVVAGRGALDFAGGLVALQDDAANDRTIVHIGKQPDLTDLFVTANANPRLTLGTAGAAQSHRINDRLSVNGAINASDVMTVNQAALATILAIRGARTLTGAAATLNQLAAGASLDLAGFNVTTQRGLLFSGTFNNTGGAALITNLELMAATAFGTFPATNLRYLTAPAPAWGTQPANVYGIDYPDFSAVAGGNTYGYRQADITQGPVARSLEHGPIGAPWLRMLMSGEWAPAANLTPLYLAEGAVPTLRNVQWKNPGAAGANLLATDRVMVLV
jgi:hypothetical protein